MGVVGQPNAVVYAIASTLALTKKSLFFEVPLSLHRNYLQLYDCSL